MEEMCNIAALFSRDKLGKIGILFNCQTPEDPSAVFLFVVHTVTAFLRCTNVCIYWIVKCDLGGGGVRQQH